MMKVWHEVRFEYLNGDWFRLGVVKFPDEENAFHYGQAIKDMIGKNLRQINLSFHDEETGEEIKFYKLKRIEKLVGIFRCTEQEIKEDRKLLG